MNARTVLLALLAAAGVSQAIAPVEAYGNLQVKSAKLCDSTGTPVTLRGMSLYWSMHPNGYKYYNSNTIKWLQSDWHVTIIRAAMGIESSNWSSGGQSGTNYGYLDQPDVNQGRVETAIQAAIDAGIYVIVDWHDHNATQHTAQAKTFFSTMAKKYGNTPNIIWEIFNEPTQSWGEVSNYAKQVIPEIRKYSNNPIVVGNSSWSANPQEAGTELDGYSNILYTIHFYAASHSFRSNIDGAMAKGHAVMATEWGTTSYTGDGTVDLSSSQTWIDYMEGKGVSHCNWSIADLAETSAALNAGASNTGGWASTDLKQSGTFVRNMLIAKNLYKGVAFTPPDTATKLVSALKADTVALHSNGVDTILFTAQYNKTVTAWTLTLTGQTSGAIFTASGNLTSNVAVKFAATMKKAFTTKTFQAGEKVVATLTPAGKVPASATTSVTVLTAVGVAPRVQELQLGWHEGRITLPSTSLVHGQPVTVRLIGLDGRTLWSKSATVQDIEGGAIIALDRPSIRSLALLEIDGGATRFRSRIQPTF